MSGLFLIELRGLRFFASHGMYEEEKKVGNEFEVDVTIECNSPGNKIDSLDQTVDYVDVYRILQEEFSIHHYLLETCAMQISEKLKKRFEQIKKLSVSIRKINPPITGFTGSVGVSFRQSFK